jgi:hypothetical protein
MKQIRYAIWVLKQRFRSKEDTMWEDWYLNSNKPFIRMFPNEDESNE